MKQFVLVLLCLSSLSGSQLFSLKSGQSNRLIHEDSPYLKQHVNNPVDWYPWGEEALNKAKEEHKLIFLSIGYSTCHWCHVMVYESFEDKTIASLINKDFIAIKVDREELPHLDKHYQNLHLLMKNRSGGWPLTAILTEDAKPFFIGTYFPPEDTYNQEGLATLLPRLARDYKNNRKNILVQALKTETAMDKSNRAVFKPVNIDLSIADKSFSGLQEQFDEVYYGFSRRPKFPEASKIGLLFDLDSLGIKGAGDMAVRTLRAMALHGLYDQVEGGFFRYSVDAAWEIPHFEKMLYTNAELIPLYVKAYERSGDEMYEEIVHETIAMLETRFEADGLYYSASDADFGHQEGGYFIYSYEEMDEVLSHVGKMEKETLTELLGLSEEGNFEGYTHINFYADQRPAGFEKIRPFLKAIRQNRHYPFIDTKINTAWNAMVIEALFIASELEHGYQVLAEERMRSLLEKMYLKGVLYHQSLPEKIPVQKALLEDYAFVASALLEGYAHNLDKKYLFLAGRLCDEAIQKFYDGSFWYLSDDGLKVHADMSDKYYTAPVNKMLAALLKLASIKGERKYLIIVQEELQRKSTLLKKEPHHFPSGIQTLLREKKGYITLKSDKEGLIKAKQKIKKIRYPFVLIKEENDLKAFLACDIQQCFSVDTDVEKVQESIEKR